MTLNPAARPTTVAELLSVYLGQRPGVSSSKAWADITRTLKDFETHYGAEKLDGCFPFQIATWLSSHPEWESDWTRARAVRTVQRPFNWAVRLGLINRNPFGGFSVRSGRRGRPMTDDEFAAAVGHAGVEFRRVLRFLRYSGCRPCEARELLWSHVNPEAGVAVLPIHKTEKTRRDRSPRVIICNAEVTDLLVEILEAGNTGDHVFLNKRGHPWTQNAFNLQVGRIRAKAGLPKDCKLYGLRHRFGTVAALSGLDIKAISELLGHTTTRMSEHYIHVAGNVGYLKRCLGKVEGL
ncbi:MAG: tyrosine-type recombinase/integrase [Patescibacteria group bacterium]|nr:tyrosine-type recombinase/integrase [Patescibacteria group bacterium]